MGLILLPEEVSATLGLVDWVDQTSPSSMVLSAGTVKDSDNEFETDVIENQHDTQLRDPETFAPRETFRSDSPELIPRPQPTPFKFSHPQWRTLPYLCLQRLANKEHSR